MLSRVCNLLPFRLAKHLVESVRCVVESSEPTIYWVYLLDHPVDIEGGRGREFATFLRRHDQRQKLLRTAERERGDDYRTSPAEGVADEGEEVPPAVYEGWVLPIAIRGLEDQKVNFVEIVGPNCSRNRLLLKGREITREENPPSTLVFDQDAGCTEDVTRLEETD